MKRRNEKRWDEKLTMWIGSISSLIAHTVLFIGVFVAILFGVPAEKAMLILTTVVSLEAIYLSILIQMSVNRNSLSLEEVEEDLDEIQGDIDEIQEDIEEIQEDVEEVQEEIEHIEVATKKQ